MSAEVRGPTNATTPGPHGKDCLTKWESKRFGLVVSYVNEGQTLQAYEAYGEGYDGLILVDVQTNEVRARSVWYYSVPAALECAEEEKEVASEQPHDAPQVEEGERFPEWSEVYASGQYLG